MTISRRLCAAIAAFLALSAGWRDAAAQTYPHKPVRLIVPAPAGGPTDLPARVAAEGLAGLTGQRFVVENRAGAGGLIAGETVARAQADGYTLLFANSSVLAINPALNPNMPYDPASAFALIGFFSDSPQLLVANPKFPARSVPQLVAYAKANPGKLNFASGGPGTLPHLTYELFRLTAGFTAVHIPYQGGAPAVAALLGGQADVLFDLVRTRVYSGELRALAITATARDPDLPDVPTMAESGYPEVTSTSWTGMVGPAGISKDVVDYLNAKLNTLNKSPEFQASMKKLGLTSRAGTPEEFAAWASEQRQKWTRVVRESGATVN